MLITFFLLEIFIFIGGVFWWVWIFLHKYFCVCELVISIKF